MFWLYIDHRKSGSIILGNNVDKTNDRDRNQC